MSKAKAVIRTVSDMRKALRQGQATWTFPSVVEMNAWEAIERHIGRDTGDKLTQRTLRRLEVAVADRLDMKIYDFGRKTLPEFAELCDLALGRPQRKSRKPRRKPGRPTVTDVERDAKLADAWSAFEAGTYKDAARFLSQRFAGLTERELRLAVDRHRHRPRKRPSE